MKQRLFKRTVVCLLIILIVNFATTGIVQSEAILESTAEPVVEQNIENDSTAVVEVPVTEEEQTDGLVVDETGASDAGSETEEGTGPETETDGEDDADGEETVVPGEGSEIVDEFLGENDEGMEPGLPVIQGAQTLALEPTAYLEDSSENSPSADEGVNVTDMAQLEAAIKKIKESAPDAQEVIILSPDFELSGTIEISVTVTIKINDGDTATATGEGSFIVAGGNLTMNGGTITGNNALKTGRKPQNDIMSELTIGFVYEAEGFLCSFMPARW